MSPLDRELLSDVTASVLQDCAFLILDPAPMPDSWPSDMVSSGISFNGPLEGCLTLRAPSRALPMIASDMLGVFPEDFAAKVHGEAALRELSNVVVGVLLARLVGDGPACQIGLPVISHVPSLSRPSSRDTCSASFVDGEGQLFGVDLTITRRG
jgi:CheY-specific phosphatase CheX